MPALRCVYITDSVWALFYKDKKRIGCVEIRERRGSLKKSTYVPSHHLPFSAKSWSRTPNIPQNTVVMGAITKSKGLLPLW